MSAKIITIANRKGGCTKSTLVMLFATSLHQRGHKVAVFDNDPQQSVTAIRKSEEGKGFDLFTIDWTDTTGETSFKNEIERQIENYDYILIDVGGALEGKAMFLSTFVSDLIVIPLIPKRLDILSTLDFIDALPELWEKRKSKAKLIGIKNRLDNTSESVQINDFKKYRSNIEVLKGGLRNRVSYSRDISTIEEIKIPEYQELFSEFQDYIISNL